MTLSVTSQVFLRDLGHSGSGRDWLLWGARLNDQTLSSSCFSGTQFRPSCYWLAGFVLLTKGWLCMWTPHARSENGAAQQVPPKECFTEVAVSCWLVWACEMSPADLLLLTKAFLWLFFVWESYFYCLSLFICICQMNISLSVLVRSQIWSVLAFPTKKSWAAFHGGWQKTAF